MERQFLKMFMQPRFASNKIREDKEKRFIRAEAPQMLAMRTFTNLFY